MAAPARVRCPVGGYAPCIDDLCHGVDRTMCGLELDFDFCPHGYDPEACDQYPCDAERDGDLVDDMDE